MAFQESRRWSVLDAAQVNEYLASATGGAMTAKDFRTWHATVLAAVSLASTDEPGESAASRKRAVRQAMVEVSRVPRQHARDRQVGLRRPARRRPVRRRHDDRRRRPS